MHICIKLLSLAVSPVKGRLAEGINDWVWFKSVCMGSHKRVLHNEPRIGKGWDVLWSDWREAFLISWSYGMGDPMAPSEREGNSEGGGSARRIASREAKRAGITRP
jgi:hypothetical protein